MKPSSEGADELDGALNRGFFPLVFTDCGHFLFLLCSLLPLGFLTSFSPWGFGKVILHQAGQRCRLSDGGWLTKGEGVDTAPFIAYCYFIGRQGSM